MRKSARMIRQGHVVVLDNRRRTIRDRPTILEDGTIVLIDTEGNEFRRPPGVKIDVV